MADEFESVEDVGPWFPAMFPGECDGCGNEFDEGDWIRASDVVDGYEAKECCGEW